MGAYDRLARLAAKVLRTPVATITLVEEGHPIRLGQADLSEPGASRREVPLECSHHRHVLGFGEPLLITDVREDPRVQHSPAGTERHFVAYAGVPLIAGEGGVLGTLSVSDERPRKWTEEEVGILTDLAAVVVTEIEVGRKAAAWEEAEHARGESERRFRQLAENILEVFWIYDLGENRTIYASPAFERVWGYSPERLYAYRRTWIDSVHPEDRSRARAANERQKAGEDFEVEYRIVRPDGKVRWIWDRGFPVRDDHGEVYRVVGIAEDVTVRRRAEAALRAMRDHLEGEVRERTADLRTSERRFRALIEHGQEIVNILTADGVIRYESSAVERVLGYTGEERIGREALDFVHPEDLPRVREALADLLENAVPLSLELRLRHRDGSYRILSATGTNVLADPAVAGIVVNLRDVTELRRGEERLRRVERMEALGRLTGGIAHDFNNVLNIIGGTAQCLLLEASREDSLREGLEEISDAVAGATSLTRQLLTFSRSQVLAPEILDLNEVVRGTKRMLRRTLGSGIRVVSRLDPSLGRIRADRGQMEQVLLNLVLNARDAMPAGGVLITETRNVRVDGSSAQCHHPIMPGSYALLSVSDTGMGMPPEIRERVFEPFFTTKSQGQGTGLGLSTVYGIVQQFGGSVGVRSEEGKGTTFEIHLPRVEPVGPVEPNRSR